jgi:hypothetical protein
MPEPARLVETVLRCYPPRWRRRHGDEAAELAVLLMRDGASARSIAWSYLSGAVRARLTPKPSRRFRVAASALLVMAGSLGLSLALLPSSPSASAASTAHEPASSSRLAEILRCGGLLGGTVEKELPTLERLHVKIVWDVAGGKADRGSVPDGSYYLAGVRVLSPAAVSIRVTPQAPANPSLAGSRGEHC